MLSDMLAKRFKRLQKPILDDAAYKSGLSEIILEQSGAFQKFPRLLTAAQKLKDGKKTKTDLLEFLVEFWSEAEAIKIASRSWTEANQKILDFLIWTERNPSFRELEAVTGISIAKKNTYYEIILKPAYRIWKIWLAIKWSSTLTEKFDIDPFVQADLQDILAPTEIHWDDANAIAEACKYQYCDDGRVLIDLDMVELYYRQGSLKLNKDGSISIPSIRKMGKSLHLSEPPLQKDMKARFLVHFLERTPYKPSLESETLGKFYAMLQYYRVKKDIQLNEIAFGMDRVKRSNEYCLNPIDNFFPLLKFLPEGQWVSLEQVWDQGKYIKVKNQVGVYYVTSYSYEEVPTPLSIYHFDPQREFRNSLLPRFNYSLFFLATLGLIDLAYDKGDDLAINGLRAIRVSDLGLYLAGRIDKYEAKTEDIGWKFILSPHSLHVLVETNQDSIGNLLNDFAEQIGDFRYVATEERFLKGCSSVGDIRGRVELFKKAVNTEIPANWEAFFVQLESKLVRMKHLDEEYYVYQLPKNRPAFVRTLLSDPKLKQLYLKAENRLILIPQKKRSAFAKRLRQLGFLWAS